MKKFVGVFKDCRDCPHCVFRGVYAKCRAVDKWIEMGTYGQPVMRKDCPLPDAPTQKSMVEQRADNSRYTTALRDFLVRKYSAVLNDEDINEVVAYTQSLNNRFQIEVVS